MRSSLSAKPDASRDFTDDALRQVLHEVERDEAQAIETLCALLERIEESRDLSSLPQIRSILIRWQNCPPGGIVTELAKVREHMEKNA